MLRKAKYLAITGGVICLSCGCAAKQEAPLTVGVFGNSSVMEKAIAQYIGNDSQSEIVIKQYETLLSEEDPYRQLKMEISAGKGPDVICFGADYSQSVAVSGMTEDLYPFMEEDETFRKEDYFENILEAFAVDGKLAAVPESFGISTAAGLSEYYEGIENWDFQTLSSVYEEYRTDHILYPGESKRDVFGFLCTGTISEYLDWEKLESEFDSEEFRAMAKFADLFPDQMIFSEDMKLRKMFAEGEALLYRCDISNVWNVGLVRELFLGKELTWLGYPVTGNVAQSSPIVLGINVNSRQKEEAWELIKYFLSEEYQISSAMSLPLHRGALQKRMEDASRETFKETEGEKVPVVKELYFEGEDPVQITAITEADMDNLLRLIDSVKYSADVDYALYNIILEEIQAYFSKDKGLDEVVEVIDRRLKVAMAERM